MWQSRSLNSDAYATGQVLFTLHELGVMENARLVGFKLHRIPQSWSRFNTSGASNAESIKNS